MELVDYIKGKRTGQEARKMELEALTDPFLSDAIEGFGSDRGDHIANVESLEKKIEAEIGGQGGGVKSRWLVALVTGTAVAVILFLFINPGSRDSAEAGSPQAGVYHRGVSSGVSDTADTFSPYENHDTSEDPFREAGRETGANETDFETGYVQATEYSPAERPADNLPAAGNDSATGTATVAVPGSISPQAGGGSGSASTVGGKCSARLEIYGASANRSPAGGSGTDADSLGDSYVSAPKTGILKFNEYLKKAVSPPEDGARGKVVMTFSVNKYGRPSSIRVTGMLSQDAHREAIRLIDSGPEWTPTTDRVTIGIIFE